MHKLIVHFVSTLNTEICAMQVETKYVINQAEIYSPSLDSAQFACFCLDFIMFIFLELDEK